MAKCHKLPFYGELCSAAIRGSSKLTSMSSQRQHACVIMLCAVKSKQALQLQIHLSTST